MKRSEINQVIKNATLFFNNNGWVLPSNAKWDVTDFGLGNFAKYGLALINLADEKEYCEKLMYAKKNMLTPAHSHAKKKEDIIVRTGKMAIQLWKGKPGKSKMAFSVKISGQVTPINSGDTLVLNAGERITIEPGVYHSFYPLSEECIIGEVSTANDDENDNFFVNKDIGRYSIIEEDEAPIIKLVSDK